MAYLFLITDEITFEQMAYPAERQSHLKIRSIG